MRIFLLQIMNIIFINILNFFLNKILFLNVKLQTKVQLILRIILLN